MTAREKENWLVVVIAVLVSLGLILTTLTFSRVAATGDEVMANGHAINDVRVRLEALETNKSKATARRFTADDANSLIDYLVLPDAERGPCLDAARK